MLRFQSFTQLLLKAKHLQNSRLLQSKYVRYASANTTSKAVPANDTALATAKPFEEIPSMYMLPLLGTAWIYLPIIGM